MEFKDYFSVQATDYARFRPDYPHEIYDLILQHTTNRRSAWDCATGNGQVAIELAQYFDQVMATDASKKQLEAAIPHNKIIYTEATAEHSGLGDHSIDLITVGQALHWFDFDAFYAEVRRVAAADGLLAIFGYGNPSMDEPELDSLLKHYYDGIMGAYWPPERKYIVDLYETVPFPFEQIKFPILTLSKQWDLKTFVGYLFTWSSTQQYIKAHNTNPIELIQNELSCAWGHASSIKTIKWPLVVKGAIIK